MVHNTVPGLSPQAVMIAFILGVRDVKMREKLGMKDIQSTVELFAMADKCARAVEAQEWPRCTKNTSGADPSRRMDKEKRRRVEAVLTVKAPVAAALENKPPKPPQPPQEIQKVEEPSEEGMDKWCKIHNTHRHDLEV